MQLALRFLTRLPRLFAIGSGLVLVAGFLCAAAPSAHAQNVIATVNDDPITDFDVAQRIKLDKILRRPTTREAALEDVIADRVKIGETIKFKIDPTDQDIGNALAVTARQMKMQPQDLAAALQRDGVDPLHWKEHWKAEWMWGAYVRALNKSLDVSTSEVSAEVAKQGNQSGSDDEYTLRQVILTLSPSPTPPEIESRMKEATQLRARFTDCTEGVQLANAIKDVAVRQPLTRSGSALGDQFRNILSNTPIGHLTPPSRSPDGIEMVALCGKNAVRDDTARSAGAHDLLLSQRLEQAADKLYQEVRARAVIMKL